MKERRAVLRDCRALQGVAGCCCGGEGRCSKSFWDWDALEGRLKGANPKTGQKSVVLGLTGHTAHSERGQSQNDLEQRDPVKDLLYNLRENS